MSCCYVKGKFTWETEESPAANTYKARDHYALIADGTGTNYVTLIENDNPDPTQVSPGLPVQMHVIKVVPELYADGIAVVNDSLNKLSEKLTLLYRTPLGTSSDKYEFQWCYTTPETDGTVPEKGTEPWKDKARDKGLVSVQLGENGKTCTISANGRVACRKWADGPRRAWTVNGSTVKVYAYASDWALTSKGWIRTEYIDLE
jgi:hypothetical protein